MVKSLLTFSGKLGHSLNSFEVIQLLSEVGGGGRGATERPSPGSV